MSNVARFLMCAPEYFGVEYVINPWMEGKRGSVNSDCARHQWHNLHTLLTRNLDAKVELVPPQPGLPDLVFTANAGLVKGNICVPSHFRYPERQAEEPHFAAWFQANGYTLHSLPPDIAFEGAGDALFQEDESYDGKPILWAAHGWRTDIAAHPFLADVFGAEVVSLRLVDPSFYHLDTCFCPLPGGRLLWYPPAFDSESQQVVEARIPEAYRYAVNTSDAAAFACNAVCANDAVILNAASDPLRGWLNAQGFTVYATPLSEFLKAGGAAKCLSLRLQ